jgi:hypothetical protein
MMEMVLNWGGPTAVWFGNKAVNSRHPLQILVRLLVSKLRFAVAFITLYELAIHLQTGNNQLQKSYLKAIHEHLPMLSFGGILSPQLTQHH